MQFAIPQFTDVEDKLIGPLTLKQFLMLLATGGVVMFFYSLFKLNVIFFMFALPAVLLGLGLTFAKFNGRTLFTYIGPMLSFVVSPKTMIYRREGVPVSLSRKKEETKAGPLPIVEDISQNRLRKLAYLLDQKTEQEKELIEEVK